MRQSGDMGCRSCAQRACAARASGRNNVCSHCARDDFCQCVAWMERSAIQGPASADDPLPDFAEHACWPWRCAARRALWCVRHRCDLDALATVRVADQHRATSHRQQSLPSSSTAALLSASDAAASGRLGVIGNTRRNDTLLSAHRLLLPPAGGRPRSRPSGQARHAAAPITSTLPDRHDRRRPTTERQYF